MQVKLISYTKDIEHPFKPIILMNEKDGTTMFIRYGKNANGGGLI